MSLLHRFQLLRAHAQKGRAGSVKLAMDDAVAHAFEWERPLRFDAGLHNDKLVCVSDLHRGKRDGADDHRRAERAYNAALAWYLRKGFHLAVLGDAEDLWEGSPEEVLPPTKSAHSRTGYAHSLSLEAEFNSRGRYMRMFGNHDSLWRSADQVDKRLAMPFFKGQQLKVHEAIKIVIGGELGRDIQRAYPGRTPTLLLLHGHQGELASDVFAPESSGMVRIWAFAQAKIGAFTALEPEDFDLRNEQSDALYEWAVRQDSRPLLIAGHSHQPVFATRRAPGAPERERWQAIEQELAQLNADDEAAAERAAELELVLGEFRRQLDLKDAWEERRPCYFNTGACCYGPGELNALELGDGEIRLVRWAWNSHVDPTELERTVQERDSLASILKAVHGPESAYTPPKAQAFNMKVPEFVEYDLTQHPAQRKVFSDAQSQGSFEPYPVASGDV